MKNPILKISSIIFGIAIVLAVVFYFNSDKGSQLTGSLSNAQELAKNDILKVSVQDKNVEYSFKIPVNSDIFDQYAFLVLDKESDNLLTDEVFFRLISSNSAKNAADFIKVNKENGLKSHLFTFEKSENAGQISISEIKEKLGYTDNSELKAVFLPFMLKNGAFLVGSGGKAVEMGM